MKINTFNPYGLCVGLKLYLQIDDLISIDISLKKEGMFEPLWTQRRYYKLSCQGKQSPITAERQVALESFGCEWSLDADSLWLRRYDELIAFKQQHGHYNVPCKYEYNKSLGNWGSAST